MGLAIVTAQGTGVAERWRGMGWDSELLTNLEHIAPYTGLMLQGSWLPVFPLKDSVKLKCPPDLVRLSELLEANATLWQLPELQVSKGILAFWQALLHISSYTRLLPRL